VQNNRVVDSKFPIEVLKTGPPIVGAQLIVPDAHLGFSYLNKNRTSDLIVKIRSDKTIQKMSYNVEKEIEHLVHEMKRGTCSKLSDHH